MAQTSSKIAPFPGCLDKRPVSPEGSAGPSHDPTKELRTYIEGLQNEAREARLHQEAAEEDRDRLAEEVRRLQMELEAANEARKEVRSVIVERDNLRSSLEKSEVVLVEVRRRAEAADRQRAQAEGQRDQAMQLYKQTRKEAEQHVAAREEAARQRDAALRQRAQALRDHEDAVAKLADAHRQMNDLQRGLMDAQAGANKNDGDIQKQLMAIRQARDSAAAQAAELKIRIGELEDKIAELTYDREVSDKATKKAVIEVEALRVKSEHDAEKLVMLETLQAELAEVGQELTELRQQHASVQGAKEQLVAQLREFRETHEAMLISNTSQLESTTKERDVLRTRLQERETELQDVRAELASTWASAMQVTEPEIERLTKELDALKARAAEIDTVVARAEDMSRQREEMRLQVIELTAQLENARREIKEIGAQLAEARLQLKMAAKGNAVAAAARATGAANSAPKPTAPAALSEPQANRPEAMRAAWNRWQQTAHETEGAWELAREAAAFAGSCKAAGQQTLHRLAARLAAVAELVLAAPDSATPQLRSTLRDGIELVARLSEVPDLDARIRLSGGRVYLVENDPDASAAVAETLKGVGLLVEATEQASSAVAELSSHAYHLILLNAQLPEFDGFELCECIRGMESHANTPVVFLTDTAEGMDQAQGAPWLLKPFVPDELALRVLMEMVESQLEIA
jgi:CheY-like chemotaxis protein/chromosome segregation ATPase